MCLARHARNVPPSISEATATPMTLPIPPWSLLLQSQREAPVLHSHPATTLHNICAPGSRKKHPTRKDHDHPFLPLDPPPNNHQQVGGKQKQRQKRRRGKKKIRYHHPMKNDEQRFLHCVSCSLFAIPYSYEHVLAVRQQPTQTQKK